MEFPIKSHQQPDSTSQLTGQPATTTTTTTNNDTVRGVSGQSLSHLKDVTFAPFGRGDVFSQAAAINVCRKPGKDLVPILPNNEQTRLELEQGKQDMVTKYLNDKATADALIVPLRQGIQKGKEAIDTMNQVLDAAARNGLPLTSDLQSLQNNKLGLEKQIEGFEAELRRHEATGEMVDKMLMAATSTEILPPRDKGLSTLKSGATVHLPGHGLANWPFIATDQQGNDKKALKAVATDLKQAGLRPDHRLKMPACYSADYEPRVHFVDKPRRADSGMWGTNAMAPAQTLANELDRSVTGYQGKGKTNAKAIGEHFLRESDSGQQAQSSTVRRDFDPYKSVTEKFWSTFNT
jgi:hypothetical protein